MNRTDTTKGRFYSTPLGDLPSVTTILDLYNDGKAGALMGWAVKVMANYLKSMANPKGHIIIVKDDVESIFKKAKSYHKELKEKSAELGSAFHNLIEVYLKGEKVEVLLSSDPRLIPPFEAFKAWEKEHGFKPLKTEHTVYSELKYAGTLDCVGSVDGKVYIVDFKTSNAIRSEYYLQVAAYKWAYEEKEANTDGMGILRLGKEDGMPEWVDIPLTKYRDYFDAFMCLCNLWHIRERINKG